MTDREKLIEILVSLNLPYECDEALGWMADKLIANGVTFAKDTDVPSKWMSASEPPKEPMEYIVMIQGGVNATTLLFDGGLWFEEDADGWRTYYAVTHWMKMPEPPGEE